MTKRRMPTLVSVDGEVIGQLTRKNRVIKVRPNARLKNGREKLDPVSLVVPIEFRPPTLMDQIANLHRAGQIYRSGVPDDVFVDDDDFHDYADDIMPGGESPYELGVHDGSPWSIRKAVQAASDKRRRLREEALQKRKESQATPPATPTPSGAVAAPKEPAKAPSSEGGE